MPDDPQIQSTDQPDHLSEMASSNPDGDMPHLPHRHVEHELPPEAEHIHDKAKPHSEAANSSMISQLSATSHIIDLEEDDMVHLPKKPHTGRTVAASAMGLVLVVGLVATWFHLNQSTYSLSQTKSVAQVAPTGTSDSPATLGAEINITKTLSLTANLPALPQGHYQVWLTHADQTVSLGSVKPADNQALQNLDGSAFAPSSTISPKDTIFITIEAGNDPVQSPSKSIILTGAISNNQSKLTFKAIDLSSAKGTYVLATPTSPDSDPKSGLWFAKTDGQTVTGPGLTLPVAPDGWKYEGQVIYKGVAVEIGRFSDATKADEFKKFTPNPDNTPPFPGEDFLQKAPAQLGLEFPVDLTTGDWQVLISLEPDQDGQDPTGSDTFSLQPLKASIAQGTEARKEYPLTLDISGFPTATASFK